MTNIKTIRVSYEDFLTVSYLITVETDALNGNKFFSLFGYKVELKD